MTARLQSISSEGGSCGLFTRNGKAFFHKFGSGPSKFMDLAPLGAFGELGPQPVRTSRNVTEARFLSPETEEKLRLDDKASDEAGGHYTAPDSGKCTSIRLDERFVRLQVK
eukprot:GHVN01009743.1.p1 GENE.GHVN01009743.1~~GHVN01009743.1.p1  ORF type:complete len:111 (+),score=9.73 GHVN01009743.1:176-508(+)